MSQRENAQTRQEEAGLHQLQRRGKTTSFGRSKQVSLSPKCPLHLQVPEDIQEEISLLLCVMHLLHPATTHFYITCMDLLFQAFLCKAL